MQYEEVLRKSQNIGNNSSAVVEMLFVATIWYLVITTIFSIGQFYLERHYARGSVRQLPATPWQRVRQLVFASAAARQQARIRIGGAGA